LKLFFKSLRNQFLLSKYFFKKEWDLLTLL